MSTMRIARLAVVLLAALAAAGCRPVSVEEAAARAPRRSSLRITTEEIREGQFETAHHIVQMLRPAWLNVRRTGATDGDDVVVYYNNLRIGGPGELRQVDAARVVSMQYLPPIDARARFGEGHGLGVILVTGN